MQQYRQWYYSDTSSRYFSSISTPILTSLISESESTFSSSTAAIFLIFALFTLSNPYSIYPSFRRYLNSSWNFTFKVWEKSGNFIGSYYWKFSFSWHFGIFCKWLLNLLKSFSYLFSLLSLRQSAPFEYCFVSENSSNYWLKQSFCGFFVWQYVTQNWRDYSNSVFAWLI